jgi:hypothetical protein
MATRRGRAGTPRLALALGILVACLLLSPLGAALRLSSDPGPPSPSRRATRALDPAAAAPSPPSARSPGAAGATERQAGNGPCLKPFCATEAANVGPSQVGIGPSWSNVTSMSAAPPARSGAAMAFDGAPGAGYDILFGGATSSGYLNDTWELANGSWSNITRGACRSTCPPPLADAGMAFDPSAGALVLAGGESACPSNGCAVHDNPDIYLFRNGTWGLGPGSFSTGASALAAPSIAWDAAGDCVLIFGGVSAGGLRNVTDCYNATSGGVTAVGGPSPPGLYGASMTNSTLRGNGSQGFDVLFGGSSNQGPLDGTWVLSQGIWTPVTLGANGPPPGRTFGAMAESPAAALPGTNASGDVVLFGGLGAHGSLNDTWTFRLSQLPTAGGPAYGNWTPDDSVPAPPAVIAPSAALDFAADRIVLTEGSSPSAPGGIAQTWAYYHFVVTLRESLAELSAGSPLNFSVSAVGGEPPYSYAYSGLPTGCSGGNVSSFSCVPADRGHFSPAVTVTDRGGRTLTRNLSLVVDPYGSQILLRTELAGYLYEGVSLNDALEIDTSINGANPVSVLGTIVAPTGPSGTPVSFVHGTGDAWSGSLNAGNLTPGARLDVVANFTNWSLSLTHPFEVVETPPWMRSILNLTGTSFGTTAQVAINGTPGGSWDHMWDDPYAVTVDMNWTLSNMFLFGIPVIGPSLDAVAGQYILTPGIVAVFSFDSAGNVSLSGGLQCKFGISIGPIDLDLSLPAHTSSYAPAAVGALGACLGDQGVLDVESMGWELSVLLGASIGGGFRVVPLHASDPALGYTVDWENVSATIDTGATTSGDIPTPWSIEVPDVGPEGFVVHVELGFSFDPTLILTNTTGPGNILPGLDINASTQSNVQLTVGIGAKLAADLGNDAGLSVTLEGTGTIAAAFESPMEPHFAGASITLALDGVAHLIIFDYTLHLLKGTWTYDPRSGWSFSGTVLPNSLPSDLAAGALPPSSSPAAAGNWSLLPRYYNGSQYSENVWNASRTAGPALEDVYPGTSVSIASTSSGTLLALTSDNVAQPERQALGLQGYCIDDSRHLNATLLPSIPGSVTFSPQLLGLSNGSVRVLFDSVPTSALSGDDPANLTSAALESSFGDSTGSRWSPPSTIQDWGVPISYVASPCEAEGTLAVLDAPSFVPGPTTSERVLLYDLATGRLEGNTSVAGMASLGGYDCATGLATLYGVDGQASLFDLSAGGALGITYATGPGWNLSAVSWVYGAPGMATLLYRSPAEDEVVLYDPRTGSSLSALATPSNTSEVQAVAYGGGYYVFVATSDGVYPFFLSPSNRTAFPEIPAPGIVSAGIALGGGRIVLFGVLQSGNATAPMDDLVLAILPLPALANSTARVPPPPSLWALLEANLVTVILSALLAGLVAVAVLLGVRRRPPAREGPAAPSRSTSNDRAEVRLNGANDPRSSSGAAAAGRPRAGTPEAPAAGPPRLGQDPGGDGQPEGGDAAEDHAGPAGGRPPYGGLARATPTDPA